MSTSLSNISRARAALAKARTLDDVLEIRDKAEAIRVYQRSINESLESQNLAAEIKLRAERKAGELLAGMEKRNGSRGVGKKVESHDATPLSDLGINRDQSSRWQREATVPEKVFERHVAEATEQQKELTQASVLKLAGAGHVAQSTGENEWYTPPKWIEIARETMGSIDLDPASSKVAQKTVKAKRHFTIADDGLSKNWKGNVWLNPPYSKDLIGRFSVKVLEELESNRVKQLCLLVNNSTDTSWFHQVANKCNAIAFPRGRIKFLDRKGRPANSPLQGQMLMYFGPREEEFMATAVDCACFLAKSAKGKNPTKSFASELRNLWANADEPGRHAMRVWINDNT